MLTTLTALRRVEAGRRVENAHAPLVRAVPDGIARANAQVGRLQRQHTRQRLAVVAAALAALALLPVVAALAGLARRSWRTSWGIRWANSRRTGAERLAEGVWRVHGGCAGGPPRRGGQQGGA